MEWSMNLSSIDKEQLLEGIWFIRGFWDSWKFLWLSSLVSFPLGVPLFWVMLLFMKMAICPIKIEVVFERWVVGTDLVANGLAFDVFGGCFSARVLEVAADVKMEVFFFWRLEAFELQQIDWQIKQFYRILANIYTHSISLLRVSVLSTWPNCPAPALC